MLTSLIYACTAGASGCYAVALAAELKGKHSLTFRSMLCGAFLCILLFIYNAELARALPFGNMRHVLCFLPLASVFPLLYGKHDLRLHGWMSAMSIIALIGALCMPLQATWRQAPALQSAWFAPHVTSYVIAYGWLTVAALMALTSYTRPARAEAEMRAAEHLVVLAFPLLTFGLGSGALWADEAWGAYWSWDIKETWALLTWCLYLIWFHLRRSTPLLSRRPLLILAWVAVLITFLVVNLLPKIQSLHSYS